MDRTLWPTVILLLVVFGFFELTDADLWIQDRLYDFHRHAWLIDAKAAWPRLMFYNGPKLLIWTFGLSMLAISLMPEKWRVLIHADHLSRVDLRIFVGTLALAPLSIATLKAATNVHTPSEVRRYGGYAPYVKVCEPYPQGDRPSKRGRGFPAGHASGGFALMALAGLSTTRRGRVVCISIGMVVGTWMGAYQILKGAHYLSHTLITAIFCWLVFVTLRRLKRFFLFGERKL